MQRLISWFRDRSMARCVEKCSQIRSTLGGRAINIGGGTHCNMETCDFLLDEDLDFNTSQLPYAEEFDVVVCEQVIEHLHNTSWFVHELHRILKPKGCLLLATENLASIPNLFALLMGKAPFSTQSVCGRFLGGFRPIEPSGIGVPPHNENHPAFSGVKGHVRVMTTLQLLQLMEMSGFRIIDKRGFGFNHYILVQAEKPS